MTIAHLNELCQVSSFNISTGIPYIDCICVAFFCINMFNFYYFEGKNRTRHIQQDRAPPGG